MPDVAMWTLVMFDLPVKTKAQRRAASGFRNFLLDCGFSMVQFSVYVRYFPTGTGSYNHLWKIMRAAVPAGGQVRMIGVTDAQWAKGLHFENAVEVNDTETPEEILLF